MSRITVLISAFIAIMCGNAASFWVYDIILKQQYVGWDEFFTLDYLVKIYKFPAATIGIVVFFFFVEGLRGRSHGSATSRVLSSDMDASTKEDVVYTVLGLASISRLLSLVFSFGLGYVASRLMEDHLGIKLLNGTNPAIQFLAILLLIPFCEYWHHRLMHTPWLWEIHKVHHAASHFNGITTFRVHPLDGALAAPFRAFPAALLGVRPDILAVYSVLNLCYQIWVHSELYINIPWVRRWLVIDPSLHRIHHSSRPEHYDKNFSILTIYDRLFGTWQDIAESPE